VAAGEAEALRRRHAAQYLCFVERAQEQYESAEEAAWLDRLEAAHDNLRAALEYLLERSRADGDAPQPPAATAECAVQLTAGLWRFWWSRGYWSEGRVWVTRALAVGRERTSTRARALEGAGTLAYGQHDLAAATLLFDECLSIHEETGDPAGIARALTQHGRMALRRGEPARARALHERSLALRREAGDLHGMAVSLNNLGAVATAVGDHTAARVFHRQCLAIQRTLCNPTGAAWALFDMAAAAAAAGDGAEARSLYAESVAIFRDVGHRKAIEACLHELARCAAGDADIAIARRSARLFGAAKALRDAIGEAEDSPLSRGADVELARVRAALGDPAFEAAVAEGQAMTLDRAIAEALGE
jgi:non-specific serine/threonine protein kinase